MNTEPLPGLTPAQTHLLRRLTKSAIWVTSEAPHVITSLSRALGDAGLPPLATLSFCGVGRPKTAVAAQGAHVAALGRHDMGYMPINQVTEKGTRL